MNRMASIALIVAFVLFSLVFVGWLGLKVPPKPFPVRKFSPTESRSIPLPSGLPAPVARYYRTMFGDSIPVVDTIVLYGTGRMRPFGIWLPARFMFVHVAGQHYRHYFEATWFGIPLLKVNEGIFEGKSFFEAAMGTYINDPNTNQGANLALWAEAGWFPSIWLTDPRVRWQGVDADTALLYVPYGELEQTFVVRFDPDTGLVASTESMRYREAGDAKPKILWITRNETLAAERGNKDGILATGSAMWLDQGSPWAYFDVRTMIANIDVAAYINARGY